MLAESEQEYMGSPLSSLIAWLSLCLLSAAWGPSMPPHLQKVWAYAGLFGLAAGLGLSAMERARVKAREREERKTLQQRVERELARLSTASPADDRTETRESAAISASN